ncbi:MFS transporter [Mycobacterium camsae]|uniref:MFS transporter n=1 Tax=Mycobacterium gordonae TaxID=1778 RepID=UPI001980302D|nr:MFS transporter [Mycobacterium gordonae]
MRDDPRAVVFSCGSALAIAITPMVSVNVVLPAIAVDLHAGTTDLTWVADAYLLALAALVLPARVFGDNYGRRHTLIVGILLSALASALAAVAGSVSVITAARAVMGVGAALIMPSSLSTMTTVARLGRREHPVGTWAGFVFGGSVVGLLFSGLMLEYFSWRSFFVATAAMGAVALLVTLASVPDTKSAVKRVTEFPGARWGAIGLGALVYGIIEGSEQGWTDTAVIGALMEAAVALCLYVFHELRVSRPLVDPRLFANGELASAAAALIVQFMSAFGVFFIGQQYTQFALGYSPLKSSLSMLPMTVSLLLVSAIAPKVVERLGNRIVIGAGLVGMLAGLVLLARLEVTSGYSDLLIGTLVFGAGLALSATTATHHLGHSLACDEHGTASAVKDVTMVAGAALGIALLGSVFCAGYRSRLSLPTAIPPQEVGAIRESAFAAAHVAGDRQLATFYPSVYCAAREAFIAGMHYAFTTGAVLIGLAFLLLPMFPPLRRGQHLPTRHAHVPATPPKSLFGCGAQPRIAGSAVKLRELCRASLLLLLATTKNMRPFSCGLVWSLGPPQATNGVFGRSSERVAAEASPPSGSGFPTWIGQRSKGTPSGSTPGK